MATAIVGFLMCYGTDFVAQAVQRWIAGAGSKMAPIARGWLGSMDRQEAR